MYTGSLVDGRWTDASVVFSVVGGSEQMMESKFVNGLLQNHMKTAVVS